MAVIKSDVVVKQAVTVGEAILSLTIKDVKSMAAATEFLSQINKKADAIKAEKEKVTKPLNQALKAEQARWKPAEDIIKRAVSHLRSQMSSYQTEQDRISNEEKNKVMDRVGTGRGSLKLETAARKINEITGPETKVASESGSVSFKDDYEITVVDKHLIPVEFLEVDISGIKKAIKNGDVVHGVNFTVIKVPINRRN